VIGVIVRVEHILHRLIRDLLDFGEDGRVIDVVFVVDQDDALVGDEEGDVATVADDEEEVVLDFFGDEDGPRWGRRGGSRRLARAGRAVKPTLNITKARVRGVRRMDIRMRICGCLDNAKARGRRCSRAR